MKTTPRLSSPARSALRSLLPLPVAVGTALLGCLLFAGCSFLKPAHNPVQYFMLSALPPVASASVPANAPAVGVGQVRLPAYLFNTSIAMRRGTNEVVYLPLALWAERLDTSVQRVLAADLAALLPTDKIRLSSWSSKEVQVEVQVTLEQLDVDANGKCRLAAWWRLLVPGGETPLKSGLARYERAGPAPESDPAGAVNTLSELLADLGRQLAQDIKQLAPAM